MADNMLRLQGKVAIITGGASGIGETTARLFASHGANVVIADINASLGQLVASSIPPPARCSFVLCDVRQEAHLAAAVDHAISTYNGLDIMFCCAGVVGSIKPLLDFDPAEFDDTLAIHVRGTALAIKRAGLAMIAARARGSIICTASVAAVQGGYANIGYTAAKHAVVGLTKAAAEELGRKGIRVNCLSPYLLATPMTCGEIGISVEKMEEMAGAGAVLKGAVLRTSDVAAAALFLASDESSFISGHNLVIDAAVTSVNSSFFKLVGEFSSIFSPPTGGSPVD